MVLSVLGKIRSIVKSDVKSLQCNLICLKLHADVLIFYLNGHEAFVRYQYAAFHIM